MKTKWNILMVLVLLATLAGASPGAAQVPGAITGISPAEGTIGTQVTITGAGFGDKQGEVLLGTEKSKILAWSEAEITFMVDKPQRPGEYAVTVLLQGDKQPAEPLTFAAFAMRRPRIIPREMGLIRDGNTVTVLGQFFGDKKGELRVGYLGAGEEIVMGDAKILDWSMNTIRFELPDGVTGQFVLAIRNEVGTGLALLHLEGGVVGAVVDITDWGEYESWENASGIYYKGKFYVFSDNYNPGYGDNWRIQVSTFDPGTGGFTSISPPKGETEVPIQPLVIGDTLWVFHSGHDWAENVCCEPIWYGKYTYNETTGTGAWDPAGWQSVPNVAIDEDSTVAPVYDPRSGRISVYYPFDNKLRWFYTDDLGKSWHDDALVGGGVPVLYDTVSAIYWPSDTTSALVASSGQVIAVKDGEYRGYIGDLTDDYRFPSLVDLGGQTALLYQNYAEGAGYNTPRMAKLNYATWSWEGSTQLVYLPATGVLGTEYNFRWAPRGAINRVGNDRHLYVFYGAELWQNYTSEGVLEWYMHDEGLLDPATEQPTITPTDFSQVSAGEEHTCGLKLDGSVECWGNNSDGQANDQAGPFKQISAGTWHTCGVKTDGTLACWGKDNWGQVTKVPTGNNFKQVSAGYMVSCGLKTDNSVVCWGDGGDGRTTPQTGMTQVSAGSWHSCGVKTDGTIYCWGDDGGTGRTKQEPLPAGVKYTQVSVAAWHTCALRSDGAVACWGDNDEERVTPVSPVESGNPYVQVSAGQWHTCALRQNGSIVCWGDDTAGRVTGAPKSGVFTHIEAGVRNTCATKMGGGIVCWGNNDKYQSLPPF